MVALVFDGTIHRVAEEHVCLMVRVKEQNRKSPEPQSWGEERYIYSVCYLPTGPQTIEAKPQHISSWTPFTIKLKQYLISWQHEEVASRRF